MYVKSSDRNAPLETANVPQKSQSYAKCKPMGVSESGYCYVGMT